MSRLTKEQQELFDNLHKDRLEDYKVFSKKDYGGLFKSVVDKYPESAHFIYELLQNADDANATKVNILLKHDCLLFKHNGTKHFNVTPLNSNIVGDINAITGIGNSTKIDTQNKIGKFGVGFKSVFQYTDTPEIYDDTYSFKIENYIIPTLIEEDHIERKRGETLFVFHFRNSNNNYFEIKNRLEKLQNPILFLHNLKKIVWQIEESNGLISQEYIIEKTLRQKEVFDDIQMELYDIFDHKGLKTIYLFIQNVIVTNDNKKTEHPICVGFFYNEEKKKLVTANQNRKVFCFFPTKESFKTCFILHAPFLLTDNRQNLKPKEEINKDFVNHLSKLAAQSVVILKDYGIKQNNLLINENITEILPQYDDSDRLGSDYEYKRMFEESFKEIMQKKALLLSRNKKYKYVNNSYTSPMSVYELVEQKQLEQLKGYKDIDFLEWELMQNIKKCKAGCDYFEELSEYTIENFANDITADFMETQNKAWILKFYTFVREEARKYWVISNQTKGSSLAFRSAPIIKNQRGEWVAPFKDIRTPNVFLPIGKGANNEYNFVHRDYLSEEMAKKLFDAFEFKKPDTYDYIRNVVLNKYNENANDIPDEIIKDDFNTLLNYYREIRGTEKEKQYIQDLRSQYYLRSKDGLLHHSNEIFVNNEELSKYFEGNYDADFFDSSFYQDSFKGFHNVVVMEFLDKIITRKVPHIEKIKVNYYSDYQLPKAYKKVLPSYKYYNEFIIQDFELFGFETACKKGNITKKVSAFLWNDVVWRYSKETKCTISASNTRRSTYDNYTTDTKFRRDLLEFKWLYNSKNKIVSSREVYQEDLCVEYDLTNGVKEFIEIRKRVENLREKYKATEEEQERYALGTEIETKYGELTKEEMLKVLDKALEDKRIQKSKSANKEHLLEMPNNGQDTASADHLSNTEEDINEKLERKWEEKKNTHVNKPNSSTNPNGSTSLNIEHTKIGSDSNNEPFFVDSISQKISEKNEQESTSRAEKALISKDTSAQAQAEETKEQIEILELLKQTQKYSFKWFKLLMELMHAGRQKITERSVQIDFSKYDTICSDKIIHLSEPSIPVPSWCSDAEKHSIIAISECKSTKIEGIVVMSTDNSIDISIEINDQILQACLDAKKIRVVATDNTNFIDSLETRFIQLDKEDEFDMNQNLPNNIEFIYGPPGTGKTTELVNQVHKILEIEPNAKILVLTPTNKAADVVAIKMSNDEVCYNYLSRYGATESLYLIEEVACVTNRDTTDMNMYNIVVATASRYAYDFVQPDDTAICDYPWDYIFIDEASMIDILTITFILYKGSTAKKIIVSGDPKQIQPVTQNDMPEYNIFDMVSLHGFANAIDNYTRFPVIPLMIQHRSVPTIGTLVSQFAYDGLVQYDSNRSPQKPLQLDGLQIKDINFLGFEVAELDEIKGLTVVGQSAFNLYSAIFTYNMVEYVARQIEKYHNDLEYSIGIVCAYRAQADAIRSMLENRPLNTPNCVVTCGTVHSFQGDECDIMFIVLNPPAQCTNGTHVNNENIINVAMSRARDYLFFILPKGQQKGFFMKNQIGNSLKMADSSIIDCRHVEKVLFNNDNYIYENTHVSCHMPINVFCDDNAIYEVRMGEEAIDIKINK